MTNEEALKLLSSDGFVRAFAKQTGTPEQTVYAWRRKGKIPNWRIQAISEYAETKTKQED